MARPSGRAGTVQPAKGPTPLTLPLMICRLWRGWTTPENADRYERIVRGEVIPGIEARNIPGFRHIDLMRRDLDGEIEFQTLMWFENIDAIKAFMGEDFSVSHVPPEAR